MGKILLKNASTVIDGIVCKAGILIDGETIADIILSNAQADAICHEACSVIDLEGKWLLPGVIDDHVHFRDPGLTHKATIGSESLAAAAGGVTTVFDMPNCKPATTTIQTLNDKFENAAANSIVNHSFYLGATNDNLDQIERIDPKKVCGVKLFMGSSTGNMLVDNESRIKELFRTSRVPVAAHCEDTSVINANMEHFRMQYGDDPDVCFHPQIRSEEACYASTSKALDIAAGTDVHLHILHISTKRELSLFSQGNLEGKNITCECCPAHLWFTDNDYSRLGTRIKCNPAVKTQADREALRRALTDGTVDVIGTDHAPHLMQEKEGGAAKAASGMPVLPYSLVAMLELADKGVMSVADVVRLMCNNPARLFKVKDRGFIRKGYKADFTILSHDISWTASDSNSVTKCGWTPFDGERFHWKVLSTWVNGHRVFDNGIFDTNVMGQAVTFNR